MKNNIQAILRTNMSSLEFNKIMQEIKKKIHEARNYLLDEINHDDLMSEIQIHVTDRANICSWDICGTLP